MAVSLQERRSNLAVYIKYRIIERVVNTADRLGVKRHEILEPAIEEFLDKVDSGEITLPVDNIDNKKVNLC